MRHLRQFPARATAAASIVVICATASPVAAQCAFDRPTAAAVARTGNYQSTLIPAFVNCGGVGGNPPNTSSSAGAPGCKPPETLNQQSGSPPNGWRFSQVPGQSWGRVRLDRISGTFFVPPGTRELRIRLWLRKIIDAGGPANTTGSLELGLRATFDDPVNGDQTGIDFPVVIPVTLVAGNVTVVTTLGTVLASIALPRFPDCTMFEVVSVRVLDPNGTAFAVPGVRIIP